MHGVSGTECIETEPVRNQDRFFKQLLRISRTSRKGRPTNCFRHVQNQKLWNSNTQEFIMHSGTHTFRNYELQRFKIYCNFEDMNKRSKAFSKFRTCEQTKSRILDISNIWAYWYRRLERQRFKNSWKFTCLNERQSGLRAKIRSRGVEVKSAEWWLLMMSMVPFRRWIVDYSREWWRFMRKHWLYSRGVPIRDL